MGKDSKIEWTDHTFNPWIGCTKVSPGCAHCYAETLDRSRFSKTLGGASKASPISHWGNGAPRQRTSAANWKQPVAWNRAYDVALERRDEAMQVAPPGSILPPHPSRPRVFCASLADWLDDEVPAEWLADLLDLIYRTPNLDWLLLTKRPENWQSRLAAALKCSIFTEKSANFWGWADRWLHLDEAPKNVFIGFTAESQEWFDKRWDHARDIPAAVHFISAEPMVGPVDVSRALQGWDARQTMPHGDPEQYQTRAVGWVICGGESGPGARPMHPEWARSLRDQCADHKTPFLFKQWGEYIQVTDEAMVEANGPAVEAVGGGWHLRVGKKAAGRLLDGVEHNGFPEVRA